MTDKKKEIRLMSNLTLRRRTMGNYITHDEFGFYGVCPKCKAKTWLDNSEKLSVSLCKSCHKLEQEQSNAKDAR
jgi:hypothetical protein